MMKWISNWQNILSDKEKKMSNQLYVVMYHYVREIEKSRYPQIKGLEYYMFREQLQYFKNYFQVITMEELIASYEESYDLPPNAMLLTFDDGYIDHYTYAFPVLKEFGMQGSFFIPGKTFAEHKLLDVNKIHFVLASVDIKTLLPDVLKRMDYYRGREYDYPSNKELFAEYAVANRFDNKETIFLKRILQTVLPEEVRSKISSEMFGNYVGLSEEAMAYELYLNREQIFCMKENNMFIGLHGYDHYWLGKLPKKKMQEDIQKSIECLDGMVDEDKLVMNYPYGSYDENVIDCIKKCNCKLGLSTEVCIADITKDDRYRIPRLDTNDFPPKSENYKKYMEVM